MSDNVLPLPTRIERLAQKIRNDLQRQAEGDREWIEGTFELCLDLVELRDQFAADIEFGQVCEANGFGKEVLNHQTRAAAIAMGREPEALRVCLEATKSRSIRVIHEQDFCRFTNIGKPSRLHNVVKTEHPSRRPVGKKEQHARAVYDRLKAEGRTFDRKELHIKSGVSKGTSDRAFTFREMEERARVAVPPLDPATAAPSTRERMEAWQRAERKRLREIIHAEVHAQLRIEYDLSHESWVRSIFERSARADRVLEAYRGIMPKVEYQTIVKCLHPDTQPDQTLKAEAFRLFTQHKDELLKPEPPAGPPLPSLGELLARRRQK